MWIFGWASVPVSYSNSNCFSVECALRSIKTTSEIYFHIFKVHFWCNLSLDVIMVAMKYLLSLDSALFPARHLLHVPCQHYRRALVSPWKVRCSCVAGIRNAIINCVSRHDERETWSKRKTGGWRILPFGFIYLFIFFVATAQLINDPNLVYVKTISFRRSIASRWNCSSFRESTERRAMWAVHRKQPVNNSRIH